MSHYNLAVLALHLDEIRAIDEMAKACGSADVLEAKREAKIQELALAAADFVEEVASGQPTVYKRSDTVDVLTRSRAVTAKARALLRRPRRSGR